MNSSISLILITKNEEADLEDCLRSTKGIADEIILVDDSSSDRTLEIARLYQAKIFAHPFESYASQKQYALERATGEWILNLDADEQLSPGLKDEIQEVVHRKLVNGKPVNGFLIPYEVHFLGQKLQHAGLGREKHLRLFRKVKTHYAGGLLHEGVVVSPPTETLINKIIHRPYRDLREYFEKFERYTSLAARKAHEEGRKFRWYHYGIYPIEFLKRYVLQMGFLDGDAGLTWCRLSALHHWTKYKKLREHDFS